MIKNYFYHLLMFVTLIHLANCNWLRIGISGIDLPEQNYIEQFDHQITKQHSSQLKNHFKKMQLINDSSSIHQHRLNRKSSNSLLNKYINYSDENIFLNDFTDHQTDANYDLLLNQFNSAQLKFIKKNPNSLRVISTGTNIAIEQCAKQFQKERWNCSIEDEKEVFGQTLRRANKESAFVQAIVSAGVTYAITRSCSTGNLANCACISKYERFSDIELNKKQNSNKRVWHWGGCSDNLGLAIKLAKEFLDSTPQKDSRSSIIIKTKTRLSLRESMNLHNNKAGREAIKKLMRLKCKCHGSSGSCQLKTCWKVLPKFDDIAKYLKKQYKQAVQIEGIVNQGENFKLKRSKRTINDQSTKRSKGTKNLKSTNEDHHKSNGGNKKNHLNNHQSNHQFNHQTNQLNPSQQSNSNKILSFTHKPDIELNSHSLLANKLEKLERSTDEEEEIDEDEDYDDEDDEYLENNLDEKNRVELNRKLTNDKLKSQINSKVNSITNSMVNDRAIINHFEPNLGRQVNQQVNKQSINDKFNDKFTDKQMINSKSDDNEESQKSVYTNNVGDIIGHKESRSTRNKFNDRVLIDKQTSINDEPVVINQQQEQQMNNQQSINSYHPKQLIIDKKFDDKIPTIQFTNFLSNTIGKSSLSSKIESTYNENKSKKTSPDKSDLVYIHRSPNYCSANSNLKIFGTTNRVCRKVDKRNSDSCDSLCCDRGYDKRIMRQTETCKCEYDIETSDVKCKICEQAYEAFTCK